MAARIRYQSCSINKAILKTLKKFIGKHKTPTQVFPCEFCEIFKNVLLYSTLVGYLCMLFLQKRKYFKNFSEFAP